MYEYAIEVLREHFNLLTVDEQTASEHEEEIYSVKQAIGALKFKDHLVFATKVVNSWPKWKQSILSGGPKSEI